MGLARGWEKEAVVESNCLCYAALFVKSYLVGAWLTRANRHPVIIGFILFSHANKRRANRRFEPSLIVVFLLRFITKNSFFFFFFFFLISFNILWILHFLSSPYKINKGKSNIIKKLIYYLYIIIIMYLNS